MANDDAMKEDYALLSLHHGTTQAVPLGPAREVCKAFRAAYVASKNSNVAHSLHYNAAYTAAQTRFRQLFPDWKKKNDGDIVAAVNHMLGIGFTTGGEWMYGGPIKGSPIATEAIKFVKVKPSQD